MAKIEARNDSDRIAFPTTITILAKSP